MLHVYSIGKLKHLKRFVQSRLELWGCWGEYMIIEKHHHEPLEISLLGAEDDVDTRVGENGFTLLSNL